MVVGFYESLQAYILLLSSASIQTNTIYVKSFTRTKITRIYTVIFLSTAPFCTDNVPQSTIQSLFLIPSWCSQNVFPTFLDGFCRILTYRFSFMWVCLLEPCALSESICISISLISSSDAFMMVSNSPFIYLQYYLSSSSSIFFS